MNKALALRATCMVAVVSIAAVSAGCGNEQKAVRNRPEMITTASGVEMVLVPAGSYVMGNDAGESDEKPAHKVQLSAFLMDKHEVSQKNYEALMGKNPSKDFRNPDNPADQVDWLNATTYCNMRSRKEGLTPCYNTEDQTCNFEASGYRLPTEAEWEYACRAGSTGSSASGAPASELDQYGWYSGNSKSSTHPVGQKKANAWGLHDMQGNLAEWCNDYFAKDYYAKSPAENPRGPADGKSCVVRGGSWYSPAESCAASVRNDAGRKFPDVCVGANTYGFRCVRKP